MDRKVWAFALVSVAAAIRVEGGQIAEARIVLGGVAPIPWRCRSAERALIGAVPDAALFDRTAAALDDAAPLQHNAYKIPLARTLVRRAIATLASSDHP